MTVEEAIKRITDYSRQHLLDITFLDAQAFGTVIKALEDQKKYRWHDLRNNPEDLPEADLEKNYIVISDRGYAISEFYGRGYCSQGIYDYPEGVWSVNQYDIDVLAWREIEEFEEEEQ